MRPYEAMVIFDVGAEPSAIQAVVDRCLEVIRSNGGVPGTVDRWGRRAFAYELKHRREGYYVVIEFTADPPAADALARLLAFADEVLRHKIIRLPEKLAGRRPLAGATAESHRPEGPARESRFLTESGAVTAG